MLPALSIIAGSALLGIAVGLICDRPWHAAVASGLLITAVLLLIHGTGSLP